MAYLINNREFSNKKELINWGRGCATKIPTTIDILRVDEELTANRAKAKKYRKLTVNVKFIHITYGALGQITMRQRKKQIDLLNQFFKGANLVFSYNESEVKFVDNNSWYYMGHGSREEREAKLQLGYDSSKYLNFYTGGLQKGLLGWATFPYQLSGDPNMDGVVVLDESLPYGSEIPYNLGMTAVHEVGHWLGLYHTFQGGCNGIGDHVNDTISHSKPNTGKPIKGKRHNACLKNEQAPIHNIMNYVDDDWMTDITSLQEKRIIDQVLMYRTGL